MPGSACLSLLKTRPSRFSCVFRTDQVRMKAGVKVYPEWRSRCRVNPIPVSRWSSCPGQAHRSADGRSGVRAKGLAGTPESGALIESRARTVTNPASSANSQGPSAISRGCRMRSSDRARRRSRSSLLKMFGTSFAPQPATPKSPRRGPKTRSATERGIHSQVPREGTRKVFLRGRPQRVDHVDLG